MEGKFPLKRFVQELGERFSTSLSIDLSHVDSSEVFKWFLASILYGARISVDVASKTYREFERRGLLTPKAIMDAGWDELVEVLDAGGYARYDFKTATKLLTVTENLLKKYDGDLNELHRRASDPRDLERRLKDLGKGIGGVTVNIFLRELRGLWEKADPLPLGLEIIAARRLGLTDLEGESEEERREVLRALKEAWRKVEPTGEHFPEFEVALVRFARELRRKSRYGEHLLGKYLKS